MPYTPILATLGYVFSPDCRRVLMIHRNARPDDLGDVDVVLLRDAAHEG